ncbi:MAG: STAS domain-containing protein [Planctomycetota bacterium]|jgi:anti-anti-sigma factor
METRRRDIGEVTILGLSGTFDSVGLPELSAAVDTILREGRTKLCLNMRDLSFINSTVLGYLVEIGRRLQREDGELVFCQASKFFADTFRTLELHHIFSLFANDEEALEHFSA